VSTSFRRSSNAATRSQPRNGCETIPNAKMTNAVATANVSFIPVATASGEAAATSLDPTPKAKISLIPAAPAISPRFRERLSAPEARPPCSAPAACITAVLLAVWNSA
jgi:hypothetical protein